MEITIKIVNDFLVLNNVVNKTHTTRDTKNQKPLGAPFKKKLTIYVNL